MKWTDHLYGIEFTVEFRKENTKMVSGLDSLLKEGFLKSEVVLLAEKTSHTTSIIIFKGAHRGALHAQIADIETALLEGLLQSLCLASLCRHPLGLPAEFNARIIIWNNCVPLYSLSSSIGFVHVKCPKRIRSK